MLLAVEELADKLLVLFVDDSIWIGDGLTQLFNDFVSFGWEGSGEGVAVFHAPSFEDLFDVEVLGGSDGAGSFVSSVLDREIPFYWARVPATIVS